MRKIYLLLLLLIASAMSLGGCPCDKKHVAPPPEPEAPFDLTATVISSEQIDLTWKCIAEDIKGFNVYRRSSDYKKIAILDSETKTYSDSSLNPETTYWYKVSAYGEGGESGSSNEVSATTPPEVEMLGYSMDEYFSEYSQKWSTNIEGNVKNNTSRTLTIWVKGKFFNYDDIVVNAENTYPILDSGESQGFYMYYSGERIKRVEAWIEDYY